MLMSLAILGLSTLFAAAVGFAIYVVVRYTPVILRIFQEKPVFLPLRQEPDPDGEEVRFPTADGQELAGSYFRARSPDRVGVVVFCHEFLGDRWSVLPYADSLRDLGFDLFSFDFRNHGQSTTEARYEPLQWVSDREVTDVEAALNYLRSRPDHDTAGFGLYGISRGGGAAMVVASRNVDVWGVVTDGAFPTHGTMLTYILRWAEIYVGNQFFWRHMPRFVFAGVAWAARLRAQRHLGRRFPSVERAVARIAPRPLLMIHGGRDNYIGPDIARGLFELAGEPKEFFLVAEAKHNRCREQQPEAYRARLSRFFARSAPRRLPPESADSGPDRFRGRPAAVAGLAVTSGSP